MSYTGTERRIHKVFVTRNTEYHVRRNICVGVRDRRTGEWLHGHIALRSRISGGIRFTDSGVSATDDKPGIGESLFITAGTRDLVTSPIVAIERPERAIVLSYRD